MIYNYLSDGAPLIHINIKIFIKKFFSFWPKKKDEEEEENNKRKKSIHMDVFQKKEEEKQKLKDLNKVAFEIFDIDKDGQLNVLDLITLSTSFDDTS